MNREEKSVTDWTNWHILEQNNREEKKDKTVSFQSTNKDSMVWWKKQKQLEQPTLALRVPLILLGHFPTNECEELDFCL